MVSTKNGRGPNVLRQNGDVIDLIASGALGGGNKKLFGPIVDNLLWHDPHFLLADCQSYVDCQDQVSALWPDKQAWTRKSILNGARMGEFSSHRSIGEYCEQIWNARWGFGDRS